MYYTSVVIHLISCNVPVPPGTLPTTSLTSRFLISIVHVFLSLEWWLIYYIALTPQSRTEPADWSYVGSRQVRYGVLGQFYRELQLFHLTSMENRQTDYRQLREGEDERTWFRVLCAQGADGFIEVVFHLPCFVLECQDGLLEISYFLAWWTWITENW